MKSFSIEKSKVSIFERFVFLGLLFIFSLSLYYKPISYNKIDTGVIKLPDFSIFHYFGIRGPTCGLTRSFVNIAHGRFFDGFLANFMGPFVFLAFFASFVYLGYRFIGGKKKLKSNLSINSKRLITIIITMAFLISWIIKLSTPLKL